LEPMFSNEDAATEWFEKARWNGETCCPRCNGIDRVREVANRKPMKWHCGDCRRYFSVRTGTVLERSKIPLRKWAYGIFLWTTSLTGVSSATLHLDLAISQAAARFMAHRLRKACVHGGGHFDPVEPNGLPSGERQ